MPTARPLLTFALVGMLAACNASADESPQTAADSTPADCDPLETRDPNADGQQPAFPGQTRACELESNVAFDVQVIATGLDHPWAVEPLPNGSLLVTERPGRMRIVSASGQVGGPISG